MLGRFFFFRRVETLLLRKKKHRGTGATKKVPQSNSAANNTTREHDISTILEILSWRHGRPACWSTFLLSFRPSFRTRRTTRVKNESGIVHVRLPLPFFLAGPTARGTAMASAPAGSGRNSFIRLSCLTSSSFRRTYLLPSPKRIVEMHHQEVVQSVRLCYNNHHA
jgi:hypothetical protein